MNKLNLTLIFLLGFYILSCRTYTYQDYGIEKNLWIFANDILENPYKIKDIKKNYPDLYDEQYIGDLFSDSAKDTAYINQLISFIKDKFSGMNYNTKIDILGYNPGEEELFRKHIKYQGLTLSEIYGFGIRRNDQGIEFEFIKNNGKYYFCRAGMYYFGGKNDLDNNNK